MHRQKKVGFYNDNREKEIILQEVFFTKQHLLFAGIANLKKKNNGTGNLLPLTNFYFGYTPLI